MTRTKDLAAGVRLVYDHQGAIVSQASAARAVGTTMSVKELFKPLPVRYKVRVVVTWLPDRAWSYYVVSYGGFSLTSHDSGATEGRKYEI